MAVRLRVAADSEDLLIVVRNESKQVAMMPRLILSLTSNGEQGARCCWADVAPSKKTLFPREEERLTVAPRSLRWCSEINRVNGECKLRPLAEVLRPGKYVARVLIDKGQPASEEIFYSVR